MWGWINSMNKIMVFVICVFLASCSVASITPRLGTMPEGMCTRDINQWGQSGHCSCEEGKTYDERAGLCLAAGGGGKVIVQGTIVAGMDAIRGETTGFEIRNFEGVSYHLALKVDDRKKLQDLSGLWFEVIGDVVIVESAEMKNRKIIIVDSLHFLE